MRPAIIAEEGVRAGQRVTAGKNEAATRNGESKKWRDLYNRWNWAGNRDVSRLEIREYATDRTPVS